MTSTRNAIVCLAMLTAACAETPESAPAAFQAFDAPFASVSSGGHQAISVFDMARSTGGDNGDGTWNLWSEGTAETWVSFPTAGTYTIGADAFGSFAGGDWPNLQLQLDGVQVANTAIRTSQLTHVAFSVNVTAGAHRVGIAFTNDFWNGVDDRNLYLAGITIDAPSAPAPSGNERYVATHGSDDGDGSAGRPFASLSRAARDATSGTTIVLADGTYDEGASIVLPVGVSIRGPGAARAVVRSRLGDWLIRVQSSPVVSGQQSISGFTIDGQGRALAHGIVVQGRNDVRVSDVRFVDIADRGLDINSGVWSDEYNGPSAYVGGIEVDHCTFERSGADHGDWVDGNLSIGQMDGGYIHDNVIVDGPGGGEGIKLSGYGWVRHLRVSHNTTRLSGINAAWGSNPGIELWSLSDDCEVDGNDVDTWISLVHGNRGGGTRSVRVHDNVVNVPREAYRREALEIAHGLSDVEIDHNVFRGSAFGVAIWGFANQHQTNLSVHHNVFTTMHDPRGWQSGIELHPDQGAVFSDFRIDNNVFHSVESQPYTVVGIKSVNPGTLRGFFVRNNVFMNSVGNSNESIFEAYGSAVAGVVFDDNLLFNVNTGNSAASYQSTKTGDPQLDDAFRPRAGSPVIDAGFDVGLAYRGSAPDLGAFEY